VLNRLLKNIFHTSTLRLGSGQAGSAWTENHQQLHPRPVRPERIEGLLIKLATVSKREGNKPKTSTSQGNP
jgi:hypothetical protein